MKEVTIHPAESGQKCIRFCTRLLPGAGTGFLYKMLRKKNITLNGKKADGSEVLRAGDVLTFFFADETFAKFAGTKMPVCDQKGSVSATADRRKAKRPAYEQTHKQEEKSFALVPSRILYEDEDILLYNKPAGLLTQKAKPSDVSLNDMLLAYLQNCTAAETGSGIVRPSVCNRLDRNTSGIVICGKTYKGLTGMNRLIKERTIGKYYLCVVAGKMDQPLLLHGYLKKDEKTNQVLIRDDMFPGASYIETECRPLRSADTCTLLEVHLITGKTHQIRAHLSYVGHPLIGDTKYGDSAVNRIYQRKYGLKSQLLHAYRLVFPADVLSGREFTAPLPGQFETVVKEELSWQPGIREV